MCLFEFFFVVLCYFYAMITITEIQTRLREAIKYGNISQKQLAEALGIDPSTVSKYMKQNKYPSLDTFANLCKILDVSSDEILGLK